jgi:hypothetical protein
LFVFSLILRHFAGINLTETLSCKLNAKKMFNEGIISLNDSWFPFCLAQPQCLTAAHWFCKAKNGGIRGFFAKASQILCRRFTFRFGFCLRCGFRICFGAISCSVVCLDTLLLFQKQIDAYTSYYVMYPIPVHFIFWRKMSRESYCGFL